MMTTPNEALVEEIARMICFRMGYNPDELGFPADGSKPLKEDIPRWERYREHALGVADRMAVLISERDAARAEADKLRPLATVMREQFEDNHLSSEGKMLAVAALARIYPEDIHSRERCQTAECQDGGCDVCPSDSEWLDADRKLNEFLATTNQPTAYTQ